MSRSEISSILKNTFSVWIFGKIGPKPLFCSYLAIWCVWGQNCSGRKLCSILPQKPSEIHFSKKHVSIWIFLLNRTSPISLAKRTRWHVCGQKVSRSEVSSILTNTFSAGIFWGNRPDTCFLFLIGYTVRSGAKLFRTKTWLNFASKALSNSFFQKSRFRFEFLY